jgi:hypothetical protein
MATQTRGEAAEKRGGNSPSIVTSLDYGFTKLVIAIFG